MSRLRIPKKQNLSGFHRNTLAASARDSAFTSFESPVPAGEPHLTFTTSGIETDGSNFQIQPQIL